MLHPFSFNSWKNQRYVSEVTGMISCVERCLLNYVTSFGVYKISSSLDHHVLCNC